MVAHDGKCALKQWMLPISAHDDSCPSYVTPAPIILPTECFALENPMRMAVQPFLMPHDAIFSNIIYLGVLRKDVMVGLETKLYTLQLPVKIECEVEI